jgi:hypothetical protein
MDVESNTPETGLDVDNAIARLLGTTPSEDPAPKGTTASDEVTESEGTVKTEEAATTESRKPPVDPDEQSAAEAATEETEEEGAPDEEAESDEETEEEADEETSEDADDEEAEDDEPETVFQLDDGTEVDLDELKRGYLRQSDYTKKTQEVAEQRKAVEQANQQYAQAQNVLAENLDLALRVVEPQLAELAGTDWDALARDDAYAYAEKRAQFDQAQARYNALMGSAQQLVEQQKAQAQQQLRARLAEEGKKLQMAMPDFADPTKAKALKNQITEYAVEKMGLSENEARGITDHRMIVLLNKAMQFDALSEGQLTAAKKKVSKAPRKALKAGKPATKADQKTQARKQQRQKLRTSGSESDAVELLLAGLS